MWLYTVLLSFALMIAPLHAQIYKWTDSDGNVHFSDKPHPGAEEVTLPEIQTFSSPTPSPSTSPTVAEAEDAVQDNYTVDIVMPKDQETIRNNQGYVVVNVQISPELKKNDKVQLIFDGAPLGDPLPTTVFALRDIKRGSHTLKAELISAQGKVVDNSETVTFFMHRPRVGMVPETRRNRR